ncbi:MAG: hypothetical protein CVV33_08760 [Methanomicrobiales archaeon HGW-Methanomicrobiales-4]|nr:MAG: hypothetical protein CVV33_08760 [Methanomicrobiales archaeon HGW-Methanomicrobiales-4]
MSEKIFPTLFLAPLGYFIQITQSLDLGFTRQVQRISDQISHHIVASMQHTNITNIKNFTLHKIKIVFECTILCDGA